MIDSKKLCDKLPTSDEDGKLASLSEAEYCKSLVDVRTVTGAMGAEANIVIVDLVRNDVEFSRARNAMIIIGKKAPFVKETSQLRYGNLKSAFRHCDDKQAIREWKGWKKPCPRCFRPHPRSRGRVSILGGGITRTMLRWMKVSSL